MAGSQTFRSLQHRNVRRFFVGLTVSNVGTWMQYTAMSLLVYRLTGRGTDVGITLLCQFLPMLLLGAWAGAVADRVDKRVMAIVTQSLLGAQAVLLGVLELSGLVTLPVVYVLSLTLGIIGALDNPARRGFLVELVEPTDIPNVLALNTAVMTGSRIFGPALAALLIDPLGPGWLFVANGVSFLAIVWPMARVDTSTLHRSVPAPRGGTPVRDALRFVAASPRLLVLMVTFTLAGTFSFNYGVSLLKIADVRFGSTAQFGWLLAATSVGSLGGSLLTAGRQRVGSMYFFVSMALLGLSGLLLAWSPSLEVAYVMALPLGAGGAAMIAAVNGITQMESPPEMRGRMLALVAVAFLGSTPIGAPVTGWVADTVSAEWSLSYGSVVALVCAVAGATLRWRATGGAAMPEVSAETTVDGVTRR
ncbi:MAG: MFS transporter [Ilumatobacteraceae bacterium]